MARIGTIGRTGAAWSGTAHAATAVGGSVASTDAIPPVRALVVLDGGRQEPRATIIPPDRSGAAGARAGFVTQLLIASDPTLRPSRSERSRSAAARYAEAARRLA